MDSLSTFAPNFSIFVVVVVGIVVAALAAMLLVRALRNRR
jgi:uncharacterized membrane protein YdjX (TVP38/TMEM64 family)